MRTRGTGPHVVALARHRGASQTRTRFRAREVNHPAAADVHLARGDLPDGHAERGFLRLPIRVRGAGVSALDQTRGIGVTRRAHALPVRPGLGRARPVETRLARIKARRPDEAEPLRTRGQKLTLRSFGVGRVLEAVAHAPRAVVLALTVGRQARIARDVAERAGVSLTVFGVKRQLGEGYRLDRVGIGVSPVPARAIRRGVVRRRLRHPVELVHVEQPARVVIRVARDQREVIEIRAGVRLVELGEEDDPVAVALVLAPPPGVSGKTPTRSVRLALAHVARPARHRAVVAGVSKPAKDVLDARVARARAVDGGFRDFRGERRPDVRRREVQQRRPDPSLVPDRRTTRALARYARGARYRAVGAHVPVLADANAEGFVGVFAALELY